MDNCPVCQSELEERDCTPCHDCGANSPGELEDMEAGKTTFATYNVYKGLRLTLCNNCVVNTANYPADHFGFNEDKKIGPNDLQVVHEIGQPRRQKDKFCPECHRRLSYLRFLQTIRSLA